jgi:dolichyl-phosphate-mannose-protein mannosyltransferase
MAGSLPARAAALGAAALTAGFIAITCWWLSRDGGVPFADAGSHLFTVVAYHDLLTRGDLGDFWTRSGHYPPLTFVVGAISMLVGGVTTEAAVIGENLVYVSLLSLGCYQTARLVAGRQAGLLAVVFALGSPLVIEQFHVFMIDAPQAAMVAVAVWLILASERFARVGIAAIAGFAVGLGMESKEQFAFYVMGLCLVVVLRERGWRNWRGIAAFAGVALVVTVPWYVANYSLLGLISEAGLVAANVPAQGRPPLLSLSNLGWYFWAILNGLLFAPLFAFAAIGLARCAMRAARTRRGSTRSKMGFEPELLGGLCAGWLAITLTPHHDMRYTMGLIVYLAVLGTAWIVRLPGSSRGIATAALAAAVLATTLGATFGVGGPVEIPPTTHRSLVETSWGIAPSNQVTVYSDHDFVISAPRDDHLLGLFRALRRDGFTGVGWLQEQAAVGDRAFDLQGLELFARFSGVSAPPQDLSTPWSIANPLNSLLWRHTLPGPSRPCIVLHDGTGVWVRVQGSSDYCPP